MNVQSRELGAHLFIYRFSLIFFDLLFLAIVDDRLADAITLLMIPTRASHFSLNFPICAPVYPLPPLSLYPACRWTTS